MSLGLITTRDYDLHELSLISSTGETVDLRNIFVELQIYQDIYSSSMSGVILIKDGNDLFNLLHMCGNEYLRVDLDKPTLNQPIKRIFRIYKTSGRAKEGNASQRYALHFCSDEMILSLGLLISKAYKQKRISDIANDILQNYVKVPSDRIALFDTTDILYDIVIPNYRAYEALQWCASRAFNASENKQSFFFFENTRGYNFVSLQTLYAGEVRKNIKLDIKQTAENSLEDNLNSMNQMNIINDFDSIQTMMNGGMASKLFKINLIDRTKLYGFESYKFAEDQSRLLNKYKISTELIRKDNYPEVFAFDSFYAFGAETIDLDMATWLLRRAQHIAELNNLKIKLTLPGDTSLCAGDIVHYDFQKFVAPDQSGVVYDEYRTGKYMITSINHKFVEDKFDSVIELCSDSFSSPLPAAEDLRPLIK